MISGGIVVKSFAKIRLILETKFEDDPLLQRLINFDKIKFIVLLLSRQKATFSAR